MNGNSKPALSACVSTAPTSGDDVTNKTYVDSVAQGTETASSLGFELYVPGRMSSGSPSKCHFDP